MGIGLTVARGLVLAMGGEIEAGRSELGGLAIRLRLPFAALPPDEAPGLGAAPMTERGVDVAGVLGAAGEPDR